MRVLSLMLCGLPATVGVAQANLLTVDPMGASFTYASAGANFFDLIVVNPAGVTLRTLEIPTLNAFGTTGTIELWIHTLSSTHVGNEQLAAAPLPSNDPSGWQRMTSGSITSVGFAALAPTCQTAYLVNVPNTELAPGTYAFAIVYDGVNHQFDGVTTWPAPAGTFADGNLEVTNGGAQPTAWTTPALNAFTFGNPPVNYQGVIPDFAIGYDVGSVPHGCPDVETFGIGSITNVASAFQLFADSAAGPAAARASAALAGNSISFVLNAGGTGYEVIDTGAVYVAPSGNETVLPAVDDGESQILMPNVPVVFAGDTGAQATQDVFIHSNGYVSLGAAQSPLPFAPFDPLGAMNADTPAFFSYHDFNPTEPGSGQISWQADVNGTPPRLFVTWSDVESHPATAANPSTVQFQFDLSNGDVHIVWEDIATFGGSPLFGGDNTLIGWSPGGPSPLLEPFDVAAIGTSPLTLQLPEVFGLSLELVGQPIVGTSVDLVTNNVVGTSVGVNLLSETLPYPLPGLALAGLGAPAQTVVYLDVGTSVVNALDNTAGPLVPLTISIPPAPALIGVEVFSQSFWFDLPSLLGGNLLNGLLSSNGLRFVVG